MLCEMFRLWDVSLKRDFFSVEVGYFVGLSERVCVEDGFHSFDGGDGLPIGSEVGVAELPNLIESLGTLAGWAGEFDVGGFASEAFDDFDAISALGAFAPRFEEGRVVVGVDGILEFEGCEVFDGEFDAAFAGVSVPDAIVEAELDFLFHIAGEVVGCHP